MAFLLLQLTIRKRRGIDLLMDKMEEKEAHGLPSPNLTRLMEMMIAWKQAIKYKMGAAKEAAHPSPN